MPLPANALTILGTLQKAGFSPAQAAGILGNLRKEGGPDIDPTIKDPSGRSQGIAQWLGPRLDQLKSFAANTKRPYTDLQTQTDFLVHELNTTEKQAGDSLRQATTPTAAAQILQRQYERPKYLDPERAKFANEFYSDVQNFYKQATGASKPAVQSPPPAVQSPPPAVQSPPQKAVEVLKQTVQSAPQKAQNFLNDTLDKLKALQGGKSQSSAPTSEIQWNIIPTNNISWDQALSTANKVNVGSSKDTFNLAKNFNPTTNYYSNIASSAFPQPSNNVASSLGGSFGNNISSSFGNSFTRSFG